MSEQVCELCGTKLTAWNHAWGTQKCARCAKGRSPEARKLMELRTLSKEEIREIVIAQKLAIAAIAAWLFAMILIAVASALLSSDLTKLILPFTIFQMWTIYKLAKALKRPSPAMWVFGTFFPFIGLILLLVLNQKASRALKAAGIRVGFIGARSGDIKSNGPTK